MLITELPPAAYGEVVSAFNSNPAGTAGVKQDKIETPAGLAYFTTESGKAGETPVRRYSMIVPGAGFSGYVAVQIPENATRSTPTRRCGRCSRVSSPASRSRPTSRSR